MVYERFTLAQRWQHFMLFATFTLLAFTGLPMRFRFGLGQNIIELFGYANLRYIHKYAAVGMVALCLYHVSWGIFSHRGTGKLKPKLHDIADLKKFVKFNLGLSDEYPKFDRYNFMHKFEYWTAFTGMSFMIISGITMWHPNWFTSIPLWVREVLRIVHIQEAILSIVFVFSVHIYYSHLRTEVFPIDWSIFTGMITEERMKEEHPLEYDEFYGLDTERRREKIRVALELKGKGV